MGPELIAAIFAGVTGLATVITGYLINRQKVRTDTVASEVADVEEELDAFKRRFEAALQHIYELRGVMAARGIDMPDLPDELAQRRRDRRSA